MLEDSMSEATILTATGILRSSTIMSSLTREEIADLAGHSRMMRVGRGDIIWGRGDQVEFFGVVGSGFVKMVQTTPTGQDLTNEIMGPGQVFGLLGVIDRCGCPLSARAICDSVFLKVPKGEILKVYRHNIVLKDNLTVSAIRRLRDTQGLIRFFTTGRVEARIAAVLLTLAESYGNPTGDLLEIEIPLTRQDLSEMTGTTVESCIRTMSKLQKLKAIATRKQHIVILNAPYLKSILASI